MHTLMRHPEIGYITVFTQNLDMRKIYLRYMLYLVSQEWISGSRTFSKNVYLYKGKASEFSCMSGNSIKQQASSQILDEKHSGQTTATLTLQYNTLDQVLLLVFGNSLLFLSIFLIFCYFYYSFSRKNISHFRLFSN